MTEEINKGCEFQSDCIEYKDISYLKVMPICAIHELSIACHDKVNKCKYYKLYKQLKHLEQENKELKIYIESNKQQIEETEMLVMDNDRLQQEIEKLKDTIYYDVEKYHSALEEIREIVSDTCRKRCTNECLGTKKHCGYGKILNKINEVLGDENSL